MARNSYYTTSHWKALKRATHIRDGWKCIVPGCTSPRGKRLVCDHIETRPNVDYPTSFDVIANTRTLCVTHDAQAKEMKTGKRRQDGQFKVRGSDTSGWPMDPAHQA